MDTESHRSVSQLKLFSRCGESYRLNRLHGHEIEESPAAWTAVGVAFHLAYEHWEREGRKVSLKELFTLYYEGEIKRLKMLQPDLSKWTRTPRVKDTLRDIELRGKAGAEQADVYEQHCRIAEWQVLRLPSGEPAIELDFIMKFGTIEVWGAIDVLLEWPDGVVTIRDLKTGNREEDFRQLGIYRWAVKESFNIDVDWGEFWYIKDGANRSVDLRRYSKEYLTNQFEALDTAIVNELFIASPGANCKMCDVRPHCREMGWDIIV